MMHTTNPLTSYLNPVPLQVASSTTYLIEGGVSLKLTLVDTPGFGDAIDNTKWWVYKNCMTENS